jgi:hypothetical protein
MVSVQTIAVDFSFSVGLKDFTRRPRRREESRRCCVGPQGHSDNRAVVLAMTFLKALRARLVPFAILRSFASFA